MKNYKLSDKTKTRLCGTVLHRIVATTTFTVAHGVTIHEGDVGGWIEKEANLSGNAWVADYAKVYGDAEVYDKAKISGNARVSGDAKVYGDAIVCDNAQVYGDANVDTYLYGDDQVFGDAL